MFNLKVRYLWMLSGLFIILSGGAIFLIRYIDSKYLSITLIIILFLLASFFLQAAMSKTFMLKQKKRSFHEKRYTLEAFDTIEANLKDEKYKARVYSFGIGYSKVINDTCFKVTIVYDSDKYINQTDNDKKEIPTKGIDKCKKFMGIEVFNSLSEELFKKIPDYSFQGDKIYYDGFYYEEETKTLIEPNYITPLPAHKDNYEYILNNILSVKENNDETNA